MYYAQEISPISQTQTVTLTITSYSLYQTSTANQRTDTKTFIVRFLDPCQDTNIVTLTNPGQTDPAPFDFYQAQTRTFIYNPYSYYPSWCPVDVSCISVNDASGRLTCSGHDLVPSQSTTWTITGADYTAGLQPGTYVYTYRVTVGARTDDFPVTLTITDPCINPTIVVPDDTNQQFYVT